MQLMQRWDSIHLYASSVFNSSRYLAKVFLLSVSRYCWRDTMLLCPEISMISRSLHASSTWSRVRRVRRKLCVDAPSTPIQSNVFLKYWSTDWVDTDFSPFLYLTFLESVKKMKSFSPNMLSWIHLPKLATSVGGKGIWRVSFVLVDAFSIVSNSSLRLMFLTRRVVI